MRGDAQQSYLVRRAVRGTPGSPEVRGVQPIVLRAIHAAKAATTRFGGRLGPHFVEQGLEFRRLLLCLRRYLQLFALLLREDGSVVRHARIRTSDSFSPDHRHLS